MYDQREKTQRDYEWAISGARDEGQEMRDMNRGWNAVWLPVGFKRRELLGDAPTTKAGLAVLPLDALATLLADVQQHFPDHQA